MKEIVNILKFYYEMGVEYTKKLNIADRKTILYGIECEVNACRKCELSKTRKNPVFGDGSLHSQLMFVGEAPGRDEDIQGKPFVGRAGRIFTELLSDAGIKREDVYIANCLKCRPPNNRDPNPEELENCLGYLKKQISVIKPKAIGTLGRYSTYQLTGQKGALGALRGRLFTFGDIKIVPLYHPAYLLRNPNAVDMFINDLKKLKELIK